MERKSGPLHHRWDDCRGGRPEDQGGVCWLAANGVSPINAPPRRACPLIPPLFFWFFPPDPPTALWTAQRSHHDGGPPWRRRWGVGGSPWCGGPAEAGRW